MVEDLSQFDISLAKLTLEELDTFLNSIKFASPDKYALAVGTEYLEAAHTVTGTEHLEKISVNIAAAVQCRKNKPIQR